MVDPIDTIRRLDPLDWTPVTVSGQTKHALAEAIMTSVADPPVEPTRSGRYVPSRRLAIAGAMAAAGVLLVTGSPWSQPSRALAFTDDGDYIEVRVLDVFATAKQYNEEFERYGLDIEFEVIPVSPSFVGQVAGAGGNEESQGGFSYSEEPEGCLQDGTQPCVPVIRIRRDFRGEAEIQLGRAARPGERYIVGGEIDGRNEALEGLRWRNRTVGEVKAMLARRDYTVGEFRTYGHYGAGGNRPIDDVPDSWYVVEGSSGAKPGEVLLWVDETPVR
jgi:hypothetical protein